MAVVLTKKNTTWTFSNNGAYKETKAGKTYFPEYALGYERTNEFIDGLVDKSWNLQGTENYKAIKKEDQTK